MCSRQNTMHNQNRQEYPLNECLKVFLIDTKGHSAGTKMTLFPDRYRTYTYSKHDHPSHSLQLTISSFKRIVNLSLRTHLYQTQTDSSACAYRRSWSGGSSNPVALNVPFFHPITIFQRPPLGHMVKG
ncbi:hypothetical protein BDV09DRAFT_87537 [Aspergillus tetrazonus]